MPRVSSPVFVGRTAELERLMTGLERARAGTPGARLIGGEAGIGKTRLVSEFVAHARPSGAQVLVGDCLQLGETGLPYAPFVAALRPLARSLRKDRLDALLGPGRADLAHLLPDLGPVAPRPLISLDAALDGSSSQARLFEVILGFLRRLANQSPVVLVLEDLHWADSSTRDLLRFLIGNARDERLLVVATYRSDEMHRRHPLRPLLAELKRLKQVGDIELNAFDADEVAAQLAGITGEPVPASLAATVLARSGGNPFFAEELMAAGQAGLALSRSLRDTIEDRVRQVSADGQHILRIASVAGARIDHPLLQRLAELDESRLTDAIRQVIEHHLLVPTAPEEPPAYRFRHALVQEVVYDELLPNERTRLHARCAEAIEASPELRRLDPPGTTAQLAHHWSMAHDLERALPATVDAARAAAAGFAFAEAQAHLERALELWPKVRVEALPFELDRTIILEEAAEAAAQSGDPRRSIDLVREALNETDASAAPMRAGVLQHRLAWYLNESGDWQTGVQAMERAVELIPIDPPTPERARVLSDLAHSLMVRGRFGESMAMGEAALAISRAVDAPGAEIRALSVIGLDLACRSDLERGIPIMRDAFERAMGHDDPLALFLASVGLGWALDETARHAEALELALATRRRMRELGAEARFGGQLASKAARALTDLGRWDEALALIDETMAATPSRYAARWLLSNRIRLHVSRGRTEDARQDIATYESLGDRVVGPDPDLMGSRHAELALVEGQPLVARRIVREALARIVEPDLDTDVRDLLLIALRAEAEEGEAARAADDTGRIGEAVARATELEQLMRRHVARVGELTAQPARIIAADLSLARALAAQARGIADAAAWDAAIEDRRALHRPFDLARALGRAASVYLAVGRREDGAAALSEAHAIAVDLGAEPLKRALEGVARRARIGLEGVDTAEDAADRLGLTRREREVLALVVDGRSNRQIAECLFMAESTAGVHVSNILGKLGVARRSEAAAVAHRMGLHQGA